jgi:hypothetical protein
LGSVRRNDDKAAGAGSEVPRGGMEVTGDSWLPVVRGRPQGEYVHPPSKWIVFKTKELREKHFVTC